MRDALFNAVNLLRTRAQSSATRIDSDARATARSDRRAYEKIFANVRKVRET
jgi:hypothetical protein